jgi:hypothetical protein
MNTRDSASAHLHRLLAVKTKAQYQTTPMTQNDARQAVERATKMLEVAVVIVSS